MDDDAVLRALGEDLARTDPRLAARLAAGPVPRVPPPGRTTLWLLVLGAVVGVAAPLVLGPAAFGVMALLVLLGCPLVLCCRLPAAPDRLHDDPPS